MDRNTTLDWFGDDRATTADEGINQLLLNELKGTTNEMIKMDRTHEATQAVSSSPFWMELQKHISMVG